VEVNKKSFGGITGGKPVEAAKPTLGGTTPRD